MSNRDADPKLTKRQQDNLRARMANKAPAILLRLEKHIDGEIKLSPSQVKAAEMYLSRTVASLQSIEQTTRTETPEMSPEQVEQALAEYLSSLPKEQVQALLDKASPELKVVGGTDV